MVQHCVAYGCKNEHDKRFNVQFHSFPFKRPEILKLWITAIRRANWNPSKTSRLCSEHFKSTDYQNKPGLTKKLLKLDAVPSIFNFPKHVRKNENPRRVLVRKEVSNFIHVEEQTTENMETSHSEVSCKIRDAETQIKQELVSENLILNFIHVEEQTTENMETSNSEVPCKIRDAETQTKQDLVSENLILKRELKTVKQNLRRKNQKIKIMQELIETLRKNNCTNENLTIVIE